MEEVQLLFKLLNEGGRPANGGSGAWPLPTTLPDGTQKPGEWLEVAGRIVPCENGLHLCEFKDVLSWSAPCLYEAEFAIGTEVVHEDNKIVGRRARLLRRVGAWNYRNLRIFATRCARRVWHMTGDERSMIAIDVARKFADGAATEEELAAALDVAQAAALDAARAAAWAAAQAAAWAAARDAAQAAAWDAAWEDEVQWQSHHLRWMLGIGGE